MKNENQENQEFEIDERLSLISYSPHDHFNNDLQNEELIIPEPAKDTVSDEIEDQKASEKRKLPASELYELKSVVQKFEGKEQQNGKIQISDEASHQHPSRSKFTNPFLPAEIIFKILSILPVKSILKFKSVSKSWLALISSPEFIKSHMSILANNNINHRVVEGSELDYLMKNSGKYFFTEGSVNGLICLVNEAEELFLWNPTIRKYKKLPDFRNKWTDGNCFIYGFGYDEIHDDYKVVRACTISGRLHHFQEVSMYSLKNDSWRIIDSPRNRTQFISQGKFVNGKLYWATTLSLGLEKVWSITSFNLADEKWGKVERPCGDVVLVLGVLKSNLSMICDNPTTHVDLWSMKEYDKEQSWMKMLTINYTLHPTQYSLSQSFYLSKEGELLLMFKAAYMIHNQKDNSITFSHISNFDYGLLDDFYIQSLVCPLSQNETRIQQD